MSSLNSKNSYHLAGLARRGRLSKLFVCGRRRHGEWLCVSRGSTGASHFFRESREVFGLRPWLCSAEGQTADLSMVKGLRSALRAADSLSSGKVGSTFSPPSLFPPRCRALRTADADVRVLRVT